MAAAAGAVVAAAAGLLAAGAVVAAGGAVVGATGALVERVPADCAWALASDADGPPLIVVSSTQKALEAMARYLSGL